MHGCVCYVVSVFLAYSKPQYDHMCSRVGVLRVQYLSVEPLHCGVKLRGRPCETGNHS